MTTATDAMTTATSAPYLARAFNPAPADLQRSAGVPARLANEAYVLALARTRTANLILTFERVPH